MSSKKLAITLFSAWNTYAISMMSVLEDCGMWDKEATFQKFMGVTGIAAQFRMDKTCSALPVTDYDWLRENTCFLERIGVKTEKYYAAPTDPNYCHKQEQAIAALKKSINNGRAAVVWGIDTGEFGMIDGYDDEDEVFFAKGIGSVNTNTSMPILYKNLGKTFDAAPILYCEIPQSANTMDWKQAYIESLKLYANEMRKATNHPDIACGLSAYDMIMTALRNEQVDDFGLRYCIGIYYERKEAMLLYLQEIQDTFPIESFEQIINAFATTVSLYRKLMTDNLNQGMDGWDFLRTPISKDCYAGMIETIQKIKESECQALWQIEQFLQLHIF